VVLCTQGVCCTILHYWWYSVHRECAAQYCTIGGTLYTGSVLHKSLVGAEALNNTVLTCIAVYLAFLIPVLIDCLQCVHATKWSWEGLGARLM